jgi:protein TonB
MSALVDSGVILSCCVPARPSRRVGTRSAALVLVVAVHGALLGAVLTFEPSRRALVEAAPVFVRFIAPEVREAAPKPDPEKPRPVEQPRPVAKPRPVAPPTVAATPTPSAAPVFATPPAPQAPVLAPSAEAAAAPAPPVPPAPPPAVVPPSFNADYLQNPAPVYPALSRRLGEEGRVVLRVFVDLEGLPSQVEMRTSSGHPRLDDVALDTVRKWKFVPAKQGDKPVAAWVLVPISFSLKG